MADARPDQAPISLVPNPINVATGNKYQEETDISCGAHTELNLTRYYNSQDTTSSPFGKGWHSTWHRGLTVEGNKITVTRADGRQDVFTNNGSGVYAPNADVTSTLTALTTNGALAGWQLALSDDSVEMYLLGGQLATVTTREGRSTSFAYDNSSRVTRITGPFGHAINFAYDANGHVAQASSPDGTIYSYAYDANNNMTAVTYPDGKKKQYLYENAAFPNALTGLIDENNVRFATYGYDAQGRAISTEHAGGAQKKTIAYNTDGSASVTDANGNTRTYGFVTQFGQVKIISLTGAPDPTVGGSAFTYDTNGFLASRTDYNGNVTAFTHDARGNETSQTEASGTTLARTTTTAWLPNLHLPTQVTEPTGRVTNFAYDARGNLLQKTVTAEQLSRVWKFTYSTLGQLLTVTDPRGAVTRSTYDTKGGVATLTNALNQTTSFTNYDNAGRLLRVVDPNGLVITNSYDLRGRLVQTIAGTEKTIYSYDAVGNLVGAQQPDGSALTNSYDAAHRLTGLRDSAGNGMTFALDGNGNRVLVGAYDAANNLVQRRAFAYDNVNRVVGEQGAQGQVTNYTYDAQGNLTRISDPLSHSTSLSYDALNRRSNSTDAAGGATRFAYDALDRLTGVQDPKGLTTGYGYDGLDNQTGVASPDTGNTVKTFDVAGNVLSSTDARGMKTSYAYDALNRVVQARYADGTSSTYQYDQGQNGIGRLTRMTDPAGVTNWTYDNHGRVTSKTQQVDKLTLSTRMSYDAAGRLAGLQYPSGKTVSYRYDAAGRISSLALGNQSLISNVTYRPFGPAQAWKQGNNATFARSFDMDGRIAAINMGGVGGMTFGFDAANRITAVNETGQQNKTYGYDALDRLTNFVDGTKATGYSYDADGNRTSLSSTGTQPIQYSYVAANNRLSGTTQNVVTLDRRGNPVTSTKTATFTYDASGNTLSDGENAFAYNARGRMAASSFNLANFLDIRRPENDRRKPRLSVQYGINGLGERVIKRGAFIHPMGEVNYIYDGAGHLMGEYDARGNAIEETVYLGDLPVAVLDETGGGFGGFGRNANSVHYVNPDHLGAPHIITDNKNRKVWQWNHEPFGDTEPVTASPFAGIFAGLFAEFTYDLRFPGQVYDAETGLHYNYFRDYNPALGRYAQSDPIGLAGGVSTYGYVGGSPIGFFDPMGLARSPDWMRTLIPGQIAWDDARTAWEQQNYSQSIASVGQMVCEQVLTVSAYGKAASMLLGASQRILAVEAGAQSPLLSQLQPTLSRIESGSLLPYRNDGSNFFNREGLLPSKPSAYYKEFVVPTPGVRGPGAQRVVVGGDGEVYYTSNHYQSFNRVK